MIRIALILAAFAAIAGCTPAQLDRAQGYQDKIAAACTVAMKLVPIAPTISPWIIGGCATEAAIAKLALDPGSLIWVNDLIVKAKTGS